MPFRLSDDAAARFAGAVLVSMREQSVHRVVSAALETRGALHIDGRRFRSLMHYVHQTKHCHDSRFCRKLAASGSGKRVQLWSDAAPLGRRRRAWWEECRERVITTGLRALFAEHPQKAAALEAARADRR